jgi:hypothetical protein
MHRPCVIAALLALSAAAVAEPTLLFSGPGLTHCALSPDGATLYFDCKPERAQQIRSAPLAALPAASLPEKVVTPGVAPVCVQGGLLFARRGAEAGGLWYRDLATGEERQLRRDPFFGLPAAASADGSIVVVSRWAGRSQRIGCVAIQTGRFASLPGKDMAQPALNAAGTRLLFVRQAQVLVRDLTGEDDRQVTSGPLCYAHPLWLPGDREAIVCAGTDARHITQLGRVSLGGGEVTWLVQGMEGVCSPTVSADGRRLCFVAAGSRSSEGCVYLLEL